MLTIDEIRKTQDLFYSVIGNHGGESVSQIIARKSKEVQDAGFSLWSAKIDSRSIEKVWNLPKDATVLVMCKRNVNAKDPTNNGEVVAAKWMKGPSGKQAIPKGIKTTFKAGKPYQAYVVKNYQILNPALSFDFGHFVTYTFKKGEIPYGERLKVGQFQNTYGHSRKDVNCPATKEVYMVMELQYPFVVEIAD